jgi:hypothetical protein
MICLFVIELFVDADLSVVQYRLDVFHPLRIVEFISHLNTDNDNNGSTVWRGEAG